MAEKRWAALFISLVLMWAIVLGSTIYPIVSGDQALVDPTFNVSFMTIPLLIFNIAYVVILIFIFIVYLAVFDKIKADQRASIVAYKASRQLRNEDHCTIIIPARNEESVIKRTIMTCLEQTHKNLEVVVVCHNCTDGTVEQSRSIDDNRVKVLELNTEESGKGIALNYGVENSRGEYILILDSDGLLSIDFIENALALFTERDYAAVQGRYIPSNRNFNFVTRMMGLEGDLWSTPYMSVRHFFGRRTPLGGTGYIIRRQALKQVGMFANHLVDDYELTFRLLRSKFRIAFAPLCINYDEKPPTITLMLRQRARWARGFINLMNTRIAEPTDFIGNIYWINPIAAFSGLAMLLIPAFAAVYNLLFGYFPFTYAFIPLGAWFALTGVTAILQAAVLLKQYGRKGLTYIVQIPVLVPFSHYWFASFAKAFTVKSWANTKTAHGFVEKHERPVAADAT